MLGGRGRSVGLGFAAALLLLASAFAVSSPAAAVPAPPSCTVALNEHTGVAHPTASTDFSLVFQGTITVSLGSLSGSRQVQIRSSISAPTWATAIEPTSANVSAGSPQTIDFSATVLVPKAEESSVRGTLEVNASFQAVPGVAGSAVECADSAQISVEQYFNLDADTSTSLIEVVTGPSGVQGVIIVHNLGNGRDRFTLSAGNGADLAGIGILTSLPFSFDLGADEERNITFTINATPESQPGRYELYVVVTSGGSTNARDEVTIALNVKSGAILPTQFNPTTVVYLLVAIAAVAAVVVGARAAGKRKRARAAKRQLDKIRRVKKTAAGGGEAEADEAEPESGPPSRPAK